MKKNTITIFNTLFFATALMVSFLFFPTHNAFALTLTPIRLELSGNPGQTLNEQVTLINEQKTTETFYTSFENFTAEGETGNPTWSTPTDDLGTWMKSTDSVTLLPGEQKNISFIINIPQNAEPGGHFAGIFWGTTPKVQTGGQVAIGAKTGVLVLLSVSGPINEKGGILDFATVTGQTFFNALPVDFYYRFENSGSDRIKPTGNIVIKNIIGLTSATISGNPTEGNILPRSVRKIETSWVGLDSTDSSGVVPSRGFFEQAVYEWHNFAFGRYVANLGLIYGINNETASSAITFWVFPWQLIIVLIFVIIILYIVLHGGLRRYNKWVIARAEKMFEERDAQMKHIKKKTVLHKVVGPKIKKK